MRWRFIAPVGGVLLLVSAEVGAQQQCSAQPVTSLSNPYQAQFNWGELPDGRTWGSVSAIYIDPDGRSVWVADRCGGQTCVGLDVDPVVLLDPDGRAVRSFGRGMMAWPHGIFVEENGHVWVADAGDAPEEGLGHAVFKFSREGELLMTLGTPGVAGDPPDHLDTPSDILVAPNGEIYVVDNHSFGPPNRVIKYSADGTYLETWGESGYGPGQFHDPHTIAMDSQGRIFIGDRKNNRIQIFDQNGNYLDRWHQFGAPSGIWIDEGDVIYVADAESGRMESARPLEPSGVRNPGFRRGLYIGDARGGAVYHYIPYHDVPGRLGGAFGEGVAVDADGNIFMGEVTIRGVTKYVPVLRPGPCWVR